MKYGIIIDKETNNLGDDILTYAGTRYLPKIDYIIDRENMNTFIPKESEYVSTIINGWYLREKSNWPLSPYINPLFIGTHFSTWSYRDISDYHLTGYGGQYLKNLKNDIGCRDERTEKMLNNLGIMNTYYSGCLTLTLEKFKNVKKGNYICAVDLEKENINKDVLNEGLLEKLRSYTNKEIKVMTHYLEIEKNIKLSFEERMKNVEEYLKIYQGALCVVTTRLHVALPCIALGTPVLLIRYDEHSDRIGDQLKYFYSCTENDFLEEKFDFDFDNPKENPNNNIDIKNKLIEKCENFIIQSKQMDKNIFEKLPLITDFTKLCERLKWQKSVQDQYINSYLTEINDLKEYILKLEEAVKFYQNQELVMKKQLNDTNELYKENDILKKEMKKIFNSKRWRYSSKISNFIKRFKK